MKNVITTLLIVSSFTLLNGQSHSHVSNSALNFPNIPGYITLKTDFHIHTVFSDGNVWPTIRVQEALRDNLDAIAITEHLEYQPHLEDIPHPNRNRSYELAFEEAKEHDLIIVSGSEITRSLPAGHANAIFITDSNKLVDKKAEDIYASETAGVAYKEAKRQNAFVFWNHPYWGPNEENPNGIPTWSDFQKGRLKKGELQGIEVTNGHDYSEESLALALEHNLTIMGTSDIHDLITWEFHEKKLHRPVTLVFAKERTKEALKEALFERRTVAVSSNSTLVGKPEFLIPLLKASVQIIKASYIKNKNILEVELRNISSVDLLFENQMDYTFFSNSAVFEIEAGTSKIIKVKTLKKLDSINLNLKVLKAYTAPKEQAVVEWKVNVKKE